MVKKGFLNRAPLKLIWQQQVAAGSVLTTQQIFSNPSTLGEEYEVVGVDYSLDVASTSGTLDIRKVPASTAATGGTSLLSSTIDLATGARAATKSSKLSTVKETRRIRKGDTISMIFAGTMTNLVGLVVVVTLQPILYRRVR